MTEHANHELDTARGGYAHRQIYELIQNSADALANASEGNGILVRLTENYLYCADDGEPIDKDGLVALMSSHMSPKRDTSEIGRFGLGFKSVLGVTDTPEFYSRSVSFRFDKEQAAECIAAVALAKRYPVLRLPIPIDAHSAKERDEDLGKMMAWANNIVRLPLKPGAREDLAKQIREFPPEFLLFVDHVRRLTLEDRERSRHFALRRLNDELRLDTGEGHSSWKCFKTTHDLSPEAMGDRRSLDDSGNVPIWWAVPLDALNDPGYYWHFFPTKTASLLAGILNAPWKTNEDRQNLLQGPYNEELIDAAAKLVAKHLPELATEQDPALHLDALPRRFEAGDTEHVKRLRNRLYEELCQSTVVPDQTGRLCKIEDLSYAPLELTKNRRGEAALKKWAGFNLRPKDWLHHKALTRNRMAKVDQLFAQESEWSREAPRKSIAAWLEAVIGDREGQAAISPSMAALRTAAAIPEENRKRERLAYILLTQDGVLRTPDPDNVFLPSSDEDTGLDAQLVHRRLASDAATAWALKMLGIRHFSPKSRLRSLARKLLAMFVVADESLWDEICKTSPWNPEQMRRSLQKDKEDWIKRWGEFWETSREMDSEQAYRIIKEIKEAQEYGTEEKINKSDTPWHIPERKSRAIHARVRSGDWQPLHSVLLPGDIVPSEGDRDRRVTIDTEFHRADLELLGKLGATARPESDRELWSEPFYGLYLHRCRDLFIKRPDHPRRLHRKKLSFRAALGSGPLEVLKWLSNEGKARYTDALLSRESTYRGWVMRHETVDRYPDLIRSNPAIELLREHGRIGCVGEYAPFADVLGLRPANQAALRILRAHPMADRIWDAFDLSEPVAEPVVEDVEPFGEEEPVPLTDHWPGLKRHPSRQLKDCSLVRCEGIRGSDGSSGRRCAKDGSNIYLVSTGDDVLDLRLVARELELDLDDAELGAILQYIPPQEIAELRAAVRRRETEAEKLLEAVGAAKLRSRLPPSLLAVLESDRAPLTGVEIAQAAIYTYHTAALKEYRHDLKHLEPPKRWAGYKPAVDFVRSLGFSVEWAGQRSPRRQDFLEVEGAYSLPKLHYYQEPIVRKVRDMLCNGRLNGGGRRGMISLPTGSGKTRVAVQAVVEAMRDGFPGGVLWVADRVELCEQAVESWRQVWSSIGPAGKRLRISRMWDRRRRPLPTSNLHVIIATVQTLSAKLSNQPGEYRFLADFNLVVFDEAHRSIAPTYTSVMDDVGLTRWKREEEPFLVGLTATPYRGHDEAETRRLVNRYGSVRLDTGTFYGGDEPTEVIRELQQEKVLARADHKTIEGGDFSPSKDELKAFEEMPYWLPPSMEDRIAADVDRTRRIVEAYKEFASEEWPTLIFATSVEHAQTVAALLNSEGFRARAVSGATDKSVRQDTVECFRAGELDVLVNYAVFREGFDAPKTRAIIVARPVYSPNLYFQMIGRGLRGPKNGGNDRCLIVNVRDNIRNFNRALAFSELDWLWG